MLKKDDRDKQMVYYQAGIGTYTSPEVATPLAAKISKTLDEAVAWNLSAHVMVGLLPRHLPFTTSNTIVRTFRHAVALDERRVKFKANLWNRPNVKESTLGIEGQKPDGKK
ncbi:hypothetical protein C0991_001551 [Blastosporella zonata]|nr:hypothetical protein C0991_001551 [Blastosporella zonata]